MGAELSNVKIKMNRDGGVPGVDSLTVDGVELKNKARSVTLKFEGGKLPIATIELYVDEAEIDGYYPVTGMFRKVRSVKKAGD